MRRHLNDQWDEGRHRFVVVFHDPVFPRFQYAVRAGETVKSLTKPLRMIGGHKVQEAIDILRLGWPMGRQRTKQRVGELITKCWIGLHLLKHSAGIVKIDRDRIEAAAKASERRWPIL